MKQQTEIIRPATVIRSLLAYGDNGLVAFAGTEKPSADELALVASEDANQAASVTLRAVNTVRLSRALPPVSVKGEKDGKEITTETSAYDYVLAKVKAQCATDSTFQNVKGLIECADIAEKNKLTASPFAVKECLGYLRASGVLDKETLALKGSDPVKAKLKDGVGVNAVRPVVAKAKEKANAKAKAKGEALPFPKAGAPAKDETKTDLVLISTHISLADTAATKLAEAGKGAEAKAEAEKSRDALMRLAKLAGLIVTLPAPAKPTGK